MKRKSKKATETSTETTAAPSATEASTPSVPSGMRFSVKRKELAAHIRRLASIAMKPARRMSLPILSHVAMRTTATGLVLVATDLDVYGVIEAPVSTIEGLGGMTVCVKALGDTLRKLPDGVVTISAVSTGIRISCGGVEVYLEGVPDRDFPKVPPVLPTDKGYGAQEVATVDAASVHRMIESVKHAICEDQTRFHLAGILFEYDGVTARMVATDGHRLAKCERELQRAGDFKTQASGLILPKKGALVISKLLSDEGTADIGMVGGMFLCRRNIGGVVTTITTKVTDAQFPPHEQVIPKDNRRLVTVDRAALAGALDRAADLCSATRGVKLEIADRRLALVTEHPDRGTARESLESDYQKHDSLTIGVNPKYLIDALRAIPHERITLAFSHNDTPLKGYDPKVLDSQLSPILVRGEEDAAMYAPLAAPFLSVVMPMRV